MAFSTTVFLIFNILFFTMVSSTYVPSPCSPPPKTPKTPKTPKNPATPKIPKTPKAPENPKATKAPETPKTPKTPSPVSPSPKASCPRDTLKLGVCANLLNDLVSIVVGTTPSSKTQCCSLISGLTDLEVAVCLCTAVKASVLGINLNVPISLSLILNSCGKKVPSDFQCT